MTFTGNRRKGTKPFGSGKKPIQQKLTALPPDKYTKTNKHEQVQLPNLINIYRHEYKAKHFRFGTSLPTDLYRAELNQVTHHCNEMMQELNMTENDRNWIGDAMTFQEKWPKTSNTLRIAQLNVNGFSFAKDNFKIDIYLQGLMALQVDIAAIQEINLNLSLTTVRESFEKAMKRYDQRSALQMAVINHKENNNVYRPGGNAMWSNGL